MACSGRGYMCGSALTGLLPCAGLALWKNDQQETTGAKGQGECVHLACVSVCGGLLLSNV